MVFIHGLGASRSSFDPAFEEQGLRGLTLVSMNLPGFGDGPPAPGFSYTMAELADLVLGWLEPLHAERVHIVGHSMGGVIGLHAAERLGFRAGTFLNLEGNLGIENCLFSGKIASLSEGDFERHGITAFRFMLQNLLEKDSSPGLSRYAADLERVDSQALHRCACSLVRESREGRLMERFVEIPVRKAYFTGERSLNPKHQAFLSGHHIPCYVVPQSGHFLMDDRPDLFRPMLVKAFRDLAVASNVL